MLFWNPGTGEVLDEVPELDVRIGSPAVGVSVCEARALRGSRDAGSFTFSERTGVSKMQFGRRSAEASVVPDDGQELNRLDAEVSTNDSPVLGQRRVDEDAMQVSANVRHLVAPLPIVADGSGRFLWRSEVDVATIVEHFPEGPVVVCFMTYTRFEQPQLYQIVLQQQMVQPLLVLLSLVIMVL